MKKSRKIYIETTEGWLVNLALKNLPIKVVFNLCLNENRNIRNLAIYSLHNRSPINLVYKLSVNACNSNSYLKRETGVLLLSQLGSKQGYPYKVKSIPIFIKLINDKSLLVRKAVLVAIGHLYSNPNPDIESTMIAQVLDAPRKPRKSFITNEVTLVFLDFLCTSITCTLKRISISGFE